MKTILASALLLSVVFMNTGLSAHAQISQAEQQRQAQRAYQASADQHNEVAQQAMEQLRDAVTVMQGATLGALGGGAAGAAAGAAAAGMMNSDD